MCPNSFDDLCRSEILKKKVSLLSKNMLSKGLNVLLHIRAFNRKDIFRADQHLICNFYLIIL